MIINEPLVSVLDCLVWWFPEFFALWMLTVNCLSVSSIHLINIFWLALLPYRKLVKFSTWLLQLTMDQYFSGADKFHQSRVACHPTALPLCQTHCSNWTFHGEIFVVMHSWYKRVWMIFFILQNHMWLLIISFIC